MDTKTADAKMAAERFNDAAAQLGSFGSVFLSLPETVRARAHELRLRVGRPVSVSLPEGELFVTTAGEVAALPRPGLVGVDRRQMDEIFRMLCCSSVYSHQQEIRNGFIVLRGGHRAGICGTAVVESGGVANLRDVSSVCLRVAREILGAADAVLGAVTPGGAPQGALIFGPPGCGKTTVLRDLARRLSDGEGLSARVRVAVVDERGEIAASYHGEPQNDLGPCCDVLDGYPKGEGIQQALRCLAPDVVVCDEIGGEADAQAVLASVNAGVAVIASAHAGSLSELCARPQLHKLLDSGAFRCGVLLGSRRTPGAVTAVYSSDELRGGTEGCC